MHAHALAAFGLDLLVKVDRIVLQRRDIGVVVQRVKARRRVPGRTGGQFGTLDQGHIRPAMSGQVVQDGGADDAAADHDRAVMGGHG